MIVSKDLDEEVQVAGNRPYTPRRIPEDEILRPLVGTYHCAFGHAKFFGLKIVGLEA